MVVEDDEETKVYDEEEMELNDSDNIPGLMKEDSVCVSSSRWTGDSYFIFGIILLNFDF